MNSTRRHEKERNLDQFYTSIVIAKRCMDTFFFITNYKPSLIIEPSAGTGSFFNILPDPKIGIDIDPKHPSILKKDFLSFHTKCNNILTIGNPPFGKNSSLAIKFFQHSASFSEYIAFVLPKTFRKVSVQNRLNLNFHLIHDEDIPKNAFIYKDEVYDVPCCFQIWKKENILRIKVHITHTNKDIIKTSREDANVAIRRVGVNAGKIFTDNINELSTQSHLFLKMDNKILNRLKNINFDHIKYNTAGNPSLSLNEILTEYSRLYE